MDSVVVAMDSRRELTEGGREREVSLQLYAQEKARGKYRRATSSLKKKPALKGWYHEATTLQGES